MPKTGNFAVNVIFPKGNDKRRTMRTNFLKGFMGTLFLLMGITALADTTTTTVDCNGIQDIQCVIDLNKGDNVAANVTFGDNVYVTAVDDKWAYATDGKYGVMIYDDYSLFKKGDIITGKKEGVSLYMKDGAYAITDIMDTDGLTVTHDNTLTPALLTLNTVTKANVGRYVTLRGVTYTAYSGYGVITDADGKEIYCIDELGTKPDLTGGNKYDISGIVGYYNGLKLLPLSATAATNDGQIATKIEFSGVTNSKYSITNINSFTSPAGLVKADGVTVADTELTFTSSNENVATVGSDGSLSIKGGGITNIKATYAGNGTFAASSASYALTVTASLRFIMSMQNMIDGNPNDNIPANVYFETEYVTAVHDGKAYVTDGTYGIIVEDADNELKEGDMLKGTVENAILGAANGAYLMKDFSTSGLTITHGKSLTPAETAISGIERSNLCKYVTVKDVVYNNSEGVATFTDNDGNKIYCSNDLETTLALTDGNRYDVTGIVGYYNALQLMPTKVTSLAKEATLKIRSNYASTILWNETRYIYIDYVGDGTVEVTSSNPDVATVYYNPEQNQIGVVHRSEGTATITISATKGEYYDSPAPITVTVMCRGENYEEAETFNCSDSDMSGKGGHETGEWTVKRDYAALKFDDAAGRTDDIAIFSNSTVTATAAEGYVITKVELTLTDATKLTGTWEDADKTALTQTNGVISWTGHAPSVTLKNTGLTASLAKITVMYVRLKDTGKTVTIGETGKGTYCATENCIVGDGTVTKYITGTESNGATLTETDAMMLASGEGVLLNGKAGTYKVYTHSQLAPTKNEDNKLVGCSADTSVPEGAYVMQNQDGKVAFYVVNASDPITCPAGKAYLTGLSSEAKALFFNDGEATGINATAADGEGAEKDIYTLSGVKVNKANLTKGIYIMNGKKFIVK